MIVTTESREPSAISALTTFGDFHHVNNVIVMVLPIHVIKPMVNVSIVEIILMAIIVKSKIQKKLKNVETQTIM